MGSVPIDGATRGAASAPRSPGRAHLHDAVAVAVHRTTRHEARQLGGAQPEHRVVGGVGQAEQQLLADERREPQRERADAIRRDDEVDADRRTFREDPPEGLGHLGAVDALVLREERADAVDARDDARRGLAGDAAPIDLGPQEPHQPALRLALVGRDDRPDVGQPRSGARPLEP